MKIKVILFVNIVFAVFICCECESNVEPIEKLSPKVVWSYSLPEILSFNDDIMPVIDNGYTYIPAKGTLQKLELKSGKIIWETSLNIEGNRAVHSNKLLHSGNLLFLNHKTWVKAFNKEEGTLIWETILDGFTSIDLSIMSQNQNSLVLGGQGEFIKINKYTGELELRIPVTQIMNGGSIQSAKDPVISQTDNFIYVPTGYNTAEGLKGNLLCYDAVNGEFLWGFSGGVTNSSPETCAIQDSFIVFVDGNVFFGLNRFTGKKNWETVIKNDGFDASIIIDKGTVYMGSHAESYMYALDLDSGNLKWKSEDTPSSIITIPTVIDNRIYFSNWAYIYVLNTTDGSTLWKNLPPEYKEDRSYRYISPVAVGEGYMVCIGNKKVYCLTDPWY